MALCHVEQLLASIDHHRNESCKANLQSVRTSTSSWLSNYCVLLIAIVAVCQITCSSSTCSDRTAFKDVCKIVKSAEIMENDYARTYNVGETFDIKCRSECGGHSFKIYYVKSNDFWEKKEINRIVDGENQYSSQATFSFAPGSHRQVSCENSQNKQPVFSNLSVTTNSSGTYIFTCINHMYGFNETPNTYVPIYSDIAVVNVMDYTNSTGTDHDIGEESSPISSSVVYEESTDTYLSSATKVLVTSPTVDPSCSCDYIPEFTSNNVAQICDTPTFTFTLTESQTIIVTPSNSRSSLTASTETNNPNPSVGSSRLGKETVAGVAVAGFLLVVSLVFMALIILVCQIRVSRLKKTLAIDYQQTPRDAYNPVAISPAASTKSDEESTQGRQHAFVYQNENADCIDNIENKS